VIDTVTLLVLEQVVAVEIAVRVYSVVAERFVVVGSSIVAFTSCKEGDQLYVNGPVPVTVALRVVLVPLGIVAFVPAFTIGKAFITVFVAAEKAL